MDGTSDDDMGSLYFLDRTVLEKHDNQSGLPNNNQRDLKIVDR